MRRPVSATLLKIAAVAPLAAGVAVVYAGASTHGFLSGELSSQHVATPSGSASAVQELSDETSAESGDPTSSESGDPTPSESADSSSSESADPSSPETSADASSPESADPSSPEASDDVTSGDGTRSVTRTPERHEADRIRPSVHPAESDSSETDSPEAPESADSPEAPESVDSSESDAPTSSDSPDRVEASSTSESSSREGDAGGWSSSSASAQVEGD